MRNKRELTEMYTTVWRVLELREDRRVLSRSLLRYAHILSVIWSVTWLFMVVAVLAYDPDIDLLRMLRTGVIAVTSAFGMAALGAVLRRGAERYANTPDALLQNLGVENLTAELLTQMQHDVQRDEMMAALEASDPVRAGKTDEIEEIDELTRVRVMVRDAALAWWADELSKLDASERETVLALFPDFDGTAVQLLTAAQRL